MKVSLGPIQKYVQSIVLSEHLLGKAIEKFGKFTERIITNIDA